MLHIRLLVVGNLKERFWASAFGEYSKRLGKYCKLEVVEIKESNVKKESESIKEKLLYKSKGYSFLCDINGELVSSEILSSKIEKISQNNSCITFIIGGSDGVSDELKSLINEKISFGKITLPHQLFRIVLIEQTYRAFTIMKGEKYHK